MEPKCVHNSLLKNPSHSEALCGDLVVWNVDGF